MDATKKGAGFMRWKLLAVLAAGLVIGGGSAALASHPVVDPATVPTGFLAAHNFVGRVPVSSFVRSVQPDGADLFVQHVRLDPNTPTGWHTHPGLALVVIARGELTYEDAMANRCRRATYGEGEGFADPGFGHVHRAIAGPSGVDFYVVYVLPTGTPNHVISADPPPECL
jgi:hypothetical protein